MTDEKLIDRENWRFHYVKQGDPTKPTYYIIRPRFSTAGLFFNFAIFAGHIRYALSQGYIPVIDMQNYPNSNLDPEKLGKENAWEYFFEQPLRIGLEQAYNGENIILCHVEARPRPDMTISFLESTDVLLEWRMLVKMGLLKVKPTIMEEVLAVRTKLFAPTDRVLGVLLRGTDYVANKPKNHPIPPPIELATNVVFSKLAEWNCNKIFLATEDKSIIEIFKSTFEDLCVTLEREYVNYTAGKIVTQCRINREDDYFLQGKDYLIQILLLSMCDSFVAARCFGTVGVMILAEHFENTYFFNLGRYGIYGKPQEDLI